jgi:hypothetical protein
MRRIGSGRGRNSCHECRPEYAIASPIERFGEDSLCIVRSDDGDLWILRDHISSGRLRETPSPLPSCTKSPELISGKSASSFRSEWIRPDLKLKLPVGALESHNFGLRLTDERGGDFGQRMA